MLRSAFLLLVLVLGAQGQRTKCARWSTFSNYREYSGTIDLAETFSVAVSNEDSYLGHYLYYNAVAGVPFSVTAVWVEGAALLVSVSEASVNDFPTPKRSQFTQNNLVIVTPANDTCYAIGIYGVRSGFNSAARTSYKISFLNSRPGNSMCYLYSKLGPEFTGNAISETKTIPAGFGANHYSWFFYNALKRFYVDAHAIVKSGGVDIAYSNVNIIPVPDATHYERTSRGSNVVSFIPPQGGACIAVVVYRTGDPSVNTTFQVQFIEKPFPWGEDPGTQPPRTSTPTLVPPSVVPPASRPIGVPCSSELAAYSGSVDVLSGDLITQDVNSARPTQSYYYNAEAGVPFSFTAQIIRGATLWILASVSSDGSVSWTAQGNGTTFLEFFPKSNGCYRIQVQAVQLASSNDTKTVYRGRFLSAKQNGSPCGLYRHLGKELSGDDSTGAVTMAPSPPGRSTFERLYYNAVAGVPFTVKFWVISEQATLYFSRASVNPLPRDRSYEYGPVTSGNGIRVVPTSNACYAIVTQGVAAVSPPTFYVVSITPEQPSVPSTTPALPTTSPVSPSPAPRTTTAAPPAPASPTPATPTVPSTTTAAPVVGRPCSAYGTIAPQLIFSGASDVAGSSNVTADADRPIQYFYYDSEAGVPFSFTAQILGGGSLALFAAPASVTLLPVASTSQVNGTTFLEINPKSVGCYAIGVQGVAKGSSKRTVFKASFLTSKFSVLPCALYRKLGDDYSADYIADTISLPPNPSGAIGYTRYYYNAVAGVPFTIDVKITSVDADLYVSRASVNPLPDVINTEYFSANEGNEKLRILPSESTCYAVAVQTYQVPNKPTVVDVSFATERIAMPEGNGKPCKEFGGISSGEGFSGSQDLGNGRTYTAYSDREIQYFYYNGQAGVPFSFTASRVGGGSLALYGAFATVTPVPIASTAQFTGSSFLEITPKKDGCYAIGVKGVATNAEKKTVFKASFLDSKDSTSSCGLYRRIGSEYSGDARTEVISLPPAVSSNNYYLRYYYNAVAGVPFTVDLSVISVDADLFVSRATANALPDATVSEFKSSGAGSDRIRIVPTANSCFAIGVLVYQVPDSPTVLQVSFKPERSTPI